ncbi:MAG: hypothetical protein RML95_14230 [Anaerolineae bacterium]|nr:hypothetical protein [Anaerolineae bacterium]MDW8300484.1 hypothetical protein [Anaerolineae bacterium]
MFDEIDTIQNDTSVLLRYALQSAYGAQRLGTLLDRTIFQPSLEFIAADFDFVRQL